MSKIYYLIIEDSHVMRRQLEHDLPQAPESIFCEKYDKAVTAISQLASTLTKADKLYVILDRDLGEKELAENGKPKDGVALFFLIRQYLPHAFIVNFSSEQKEFASAVKEQSDGKETFDASIGKNPKTCAELVLTHPKKAVLFEVDLSGTVPRDSSAESMLKSNVTRSDVPPATNSFFSSLFCCCNTSKTSQYSAAVVVPVQHSTPGTSVTRKLY